MRGWLGLLRSLTIYWRPGHQRSLARLYAPFVAPGDLVFDIGAHLGDRTATFARLGARVVALEPQPHVARWLRRLVGRRPGVCIVQAAAGRETGQATLRLSARHPTVASLSERWIRQMPERNAGFGHVRWERAVAVPVTTLDVLIATHGSPRFCKIDVEGYEAEVLEGLGRAIPALSFEFVQGSLEVARACVRRLQSLADYEFNVVAGESRDFLFERWRTADAVDGWLSEGAGRVPSGDLYARLRAPADDTTHDA